MPRGRAQRSLAFALLLCRPPLMRAAVRHGAFLPLREVSHLPYRPGCSPGHAHTARACTAHTPDSGAGGAPRETQLHDSAASRAASRAAAAAATSATASTADKKAGAIATRHADTCADRAFLAQAAGTPHAVDRVRALFAEYTASRTLSSELQTDMVAECFPFSLDKFQTDALRALSGSNNVILSAPTGSGKTVVGEMAIVLALARHLRVFYTTPLKALSNQKFFDFKKLFGDDRVGLLTGDVAVNREAPIVVMTTEVYRNMLYADAAPGSGGSKLLTDDVYAVVFDEFHYLNDAERGTVWEECVVNSPSHVLLVALSATMANAVDIRDWFTDVQGPTVLIESDYRPVPLKFSFCQREGIVPLFADVSKSSSLPRSLRRRKKNVSSDTKANVAERGLKLKLHPLLLASLTGEDIVSEGKRGGKLGRRGRVKANMNVPDDWTDDRPSRGDYRRGRRRRERYVPVPSFAFVVRSLRRRDMLPAIVFIFSRNGCDRAAVESASERETLVTEAERDEIRRRLAAFTEQHPDIVQQDRINLALQGICSHHAGLLPLWKACVEELFQAGLIKVVFATETLAAGINMPARTTVISVLSKRFGSSRTVQLTTSEVLQMAGRAGRRGKDTIGYSVVMQSRNEGPLEAFRVVTSGVDCLRSHFSTSYGMALNLVQTRSLEDAKLLVERSFGSFLRKRRLGLDRETSHTVGAQSKALSMAGEGFDISNHSARNFDAVVESAIATAHDIVASVDESEFASYLRAVERVKAERRALSYVIRQSRDTDAQLVEDTLAFAPAGTRIQVRGPRLFGVSRGARRRRKRREVSAALAAAVGGGEAAELKALFRCDDALEDTDHIDKNMQSAETLATWLGALDEQGNACELLDAVLLDIGAEIGVSTLFTAVCHDGKLCFFNHQHVERVFFSTEPMDVDSLVPDWQDVELPDRSEWVGVSAEHYFAPLPSRLQILADEVLMSRNERRLSAAASLQKARSERHQGERHVPVNPSALADCVGQLENEELVALLESEKERHPEVYAQRERLEHAKSMVRQHPLHGDDATRQAVRAKKLIPVLEGARADLVVKRKRSTRARKEEDALSTGARDPDVTKRDSREDEGDGSVFEYFKKIVTVLQQYGFVDEKYCVTSLGELGAKIRSENELWASIVMMEPRLQESSPAHLAAVVGAILAEGSRQDVYVAYSPSPEVMDLCNGLAPLRDQLLDVQEGEGVGIPVYLEVDHVGLIEAWAQGESWVDMLSNTSLQEGDVCRIIRRVLDLLRQIPHLPLVSDGLKLNAKRSVALLDRFPVVDDRTYVVNEHEKM